MTWPLPAFLVWGLSWLAFAGLAIVGFAPLLASGLDCALGASAPGTNGWRRVLIAPDFSL